MLSEGEIWAAEPAPRGFFFSPLMPPKLYIHACADTWQLKTRRDDVSYSGHSFCSEENCLITVLSSARAAQCVISGEKFLDDLRGRRTFPRLSQKPLKLGFDVFVFGRVFLLFQHFIGEVVEPEGVSVRLKLLPVISVRKFKKTFSILIILIGMGTVHVGISFTD